MNLESVFAYKSWSQFQTESPFLSGPWKMRNLQIIQWYVSNEKLQLIFLVEKPALEYYAWEMPVKEEEYPEIRVWLRTYIPLIWKNLLTEEKNGDIKNNSGCDLGSTGTF